MIKSDRYCELCLLPLHTENVFAISRSAMNICTFIIPWVFYYFISQTFHEITIVQTNSVFLPSMVISIIEERTFNYIPHNIPYVQVEWTDNLCLNLSVKEKNT
jgi:hypothetical protein